MNLVTRLTIVGTYALLFLFHKKKNYRGCKEEEGVGARSLASGQQWGNNDQAEAAEESSTAILKFRI
jgi:hypothetical protein